MEEREEDRPLATIAFLSRGFSYCYTFHFVKVQNWKSTLQMQNIIEKSSAK